MINATVVTLCTGIAGMLGQKWVGEYFEDNHFYKTRFLDADGVPSEPDVGWMADASGKWGPIIVTRYVMGLRKKHRTVEFKHIINGKGRPRKLSIKAFRAAVVARPDEELTPDEIRMLENHNVVIHPPKVAGPGRVDTLEAYLINALADINTLSKDFAKFKQARPVKGSTILTKVMEKLEPIEKRIANLEKTNEG